MNVFDLFARLSLDSSEYDSGLDKALGVAKGAGAAIGVALGVATTAVAGFGKSAVSVGTNFDSAMSQVAATMGKSADEIGDLRDFAKQMGSATAFSASQAAEALNYMALAGYDAETSMEVMPQVLNLAAAGGIELGQASDMVTDALSALGLTSDDAASLVNKMAKASSQSNTSVAQLGEAILTVGGTAKNLAGGTTELSTALGLLADNGIKGAEGGTALRNIILSLAAPTDQAADLMEELGINAYDADGNLRPLEDTFADLKGVLSAMTQGGQTEVLNTLFNKVDLKSANALLGTNAERWEGLAGAIDDAGNAAGEMAETQLDNLSGKMTLMQSALEGAQIALSEKLMPDLMDFVDFGAASISKLSEAFQEDGVDGLMDAFSDVITEGIAVINDKLPSVIEAGAGLLMALTEGIIANLPAIVDSALQVILSLAQGLVQHLPQLVPSIIEVILQIVATLTDPGNLGALVDAAIAIILAISQGLVDSIPLLLARVPEIIINLVQALIENAPKLTIATEAMLTQLLLGIAEWIAPLVEKGREIVESVKQGFLQKVEDAKNWGRDLLDNFIGGIREKFGALRDTVSSAAGVVKDFLGFSEPKEGPLSNFHTYAPDMMALFARGIRDNESLVTDQIARSFDFGERTIPASVRLNGASGGDYGSAGGGQTSVVIEGSLAGLAHALNVYIRDDDSAIGASMAY